jgi:cytochrome d ubiquinol oxidase subunit II
MFDYETLRLIWWLLIGVLLIGFAVTDGFDMGAGILSLIIGKNDTERRVVINSMAPHWEGNQVWFVTAGGAIFAAWPQVYAVAFSGFYTAMLLTLCALFFRPVGFDYRSKIADPRWRGTWDKLLFVGSIVPPIVFGIAFGNLFLGIPFDLNNMQRATFGGGFFSLLTPFAILCGLVSLMMIITQGATWLSMKTSDDLKARVVKAGTISALLTTVLFAIAGVWITQLDGYSITHIANLNADSNPLNKSVSLVSGGWLANYSQYSWMMLMPIIGLVSPLLSALFLNKKHDGLAFLFSSLAALGIIMTAGCSLFPFIMPSSLAPDHSLTIWDATSSLKTLNIMTVVAAIFVPLILGYTIWTYTKMFGRINTKFIEDNNHSAY